MGSLRYAALTDKGPREGNEDSYAYITPESRDYDPRTNGSVFVVADGMGGHGGGEVASHIAVRETIKAYGNLPVEQSPAKRIHQAIVQANARVISEAAGGAGNSEMGSTIVACVIRDGQMFIGHVGDSRAYLVRGGSIQQLTRDHLYVTDVLGLPEAEASSHPMKHVLSRAVGRAGTEPDVMELTTQPGDRLLLCSDGVSNVVSKSEMKTALQCSDPEQAVMSIMTTARQRARDNVTALVVSVPGGANRAEPSKGGRKRRGRADALIAAMGAGFLVLVLIAVILSGSQSTDQRGKGTSSVSLPATIKVDNQSDAEVKVRNPVSGQMLTIPTGKAEDVRLDGASSVFAEQVDKDGFGKICEIDITKEKSISIGDDNFSSAKYHKYYYVAME